jgi:hypothetical protein
MPESQHPVDVARRALFKSVRFSKHRREVMESRMTLATSKREDLTHSRVQAFLGQVMGGRPRPPGSGEIFKAFDIVEEAGNKTADELIKAGLEAGADEKLLSTFVQEDIKHFLHAFMMSRFGHENAVARSAVTNVTTTAAGAAAARIPHRVRTARADHVKGQGHLLQRITNRSMNNPVVAWIVVLYLLAAAVLGHVKTVIDLLK